MINRIARMSKLIRQIVASHLINLLKGFSGRVTVKDVEISKDLKSAIIWISILEQDEQRQQKLFTRIQALRSELQTTIAKSLTTKFTPRISFRLDQSSAYVSHINDLLKQVKK